MPGKGKTSGWEAFRDSAGIYETTMIPAETHQAFEDLHRELYDEFLPVGTTEERLIQRLAVLNWERDRLYRYLQSKMEIRQGELNRQLPSAQSVAKLKSRAIEHKNAKTGKEVERFLSDGDDVSTQKERAPEKNRDPKMSGYDIVEHVVSLPDVGPANGRDIFFKLVEEFPIIERLKQLEQIDVAMDRTIKRFMQLKTMKQMYRQLEPKMIPIPQDNTVPSAT
jgi:hypothetical protein